MSCFSFLVTLLSIVTSKWNMLPSCDDSSKFRYNKIYQFFPICDWTGELNQDIPCASSVPPNLPSEGLKGGENMEIYAYLFVNEYKGTSRLIIYGTDFPKESWVTAWFIPLPRAFRDDNSHPLYSNSLFTNVAPVAATTASFTNGRNPAKEPNTFQVSRRNGDGYLDVFLDYNPLEPLQIPIVANKIVSQQDFPDSLGGGDFQLYENLRQPFFRNRETYSPSAKEFVRFYNPDGTIMIDEEGKQIVARHPVGTSGISVIIHTDYTTHGITSAIFSPIEDFQLADHFALFRLRTRRADIVEIDVDEKFPEHFEKFQDKFCQNDKNDKKDGKSYD